MLFIDSSAMVKLVAAEEHSAALRRHVAGRAWVGSELLRTELHRALARMHLGAEWSRQVDAVLDRTALVVLDRQLLEDAARLSPVELRTLDAIHLASALRVRAVDEFVTYDERLARAARPHGWTVVSPGQE